ncbi:MAG: DUF362 domain-containing protein [Lachnospiraceae bacterium]|nr:DUF362 domain-containing protein [Lachnospiraceae bacterium]MBQ9592722.1 DUF362 domain-containing protein [Lachnospiraceae bacterium]MBR0152316.1 DUF362 domain-containing protein [Lachnospiraceae bacterium]
MGKSVVSIVKNPVTPDAARIDEMVRQVVDQLGGMQSFVKPGDYVAIKGNFFAPYPPPVIVDRRVVYSFIKLIKEAGAGRIVLCEAVSVGTKLGRGTSTASILEEMGVRDAAIAAGAEVLCLEDDERVVVKIPDGKSIGEVNYPKTLYDCDVMFDLPCMKTHAMTLVTLGMKNFQGILDDAQKYYAHRDDFEQKIVDLFKIRKPDLTLIDGITAMEGNGAGEHGIPHPMNMLLASRDVVAVDAVTTACMGIEDVLWVGTTRIGQYDGIGVADLNEIDIIGPSIDEVKEKFLLPITYRQPQDRNLTGVHKNVDVRCGGACKQCWGLASTIARTLALFKNENYMLLVGSDPKVPNGITCDLDNVIVFGDCACSATGNVKEIRNRMLLEGKGLIAPGCPPYRPASAMLEEYLIKRGKVTREMLTAGNAKAVAKTYAYYKTVDPTWVPKSEQGKTDGE